MSTRGSALARVRAAAPWIVADMDRTLVRKVPGTFPDFNASPVKEPLLRWLGLGGRLFIVTSDDGRRPFHSMWSQIPPELRANGRVLLSTGGGATIFRGDASGDVVEVREFWDEARSGLASPGRATSLACDMMRYTLGAALRARLAEVAPTSVEPIDALHSEVIDRFLEEGEVRTPGWAQRPPSELVDELLASLSDEALLARGGVVPEKALVWRNQPGPPSSWRANWGGNGSFATRVTNVFLMGTPPARAAPTLEAYRARIFAMGVAASSAPSTICLRSRMIDKSVPVAWLDRRCRLGDTKPRFNSSSGFGFATDDAVAIGDNPLGNDAPLATFGRHLRRVGDGALDQSGNAALTRGDWGDDSDDTMAFVSVGEEELAVEGRDFGGKLSAQRAVALAERGVMYGVGGYEVGTALLIEEWADRLASRREEEAEERAGGGDGDARRRFFDDATVRDGVHAAGGCAVPGGGEECSPVRCG
tara:strand:- start:7 stop:1437 length:1431 start_codon:yes stop_codon:yes gene_type:complete